MDRFIRTEALIGEDGIKRLEKACIAVFGLGGVGGYVVEMLARSAVGRFIFVDFDVINESNLNRQILATEYNIGSLKTEEAKKRVLSINSDAYVESYTVRIERTEDLDFMNGRRIDYIADAIDNVDGKISIIRYAYKNNIPVISSMGTGNRLDPELLTICDITRTTMCPLARKVRQRLRKDEINGLKVVYSPEQPVLHKNKFIGSVSFVPSSAGILIASEIIKDIALRHQNKDWRKLK